MSNIFMKRLLSFIVLSFLMAGMFAFTSAVPAKALGENDLWGDSSRKDEVRDALGYDKDNPDPRTIVAEVINVMFGFLGIIAVILIVYSGFLWMTSGGNEDQVGKAKKMLANSAIGLIIILAAWGISTFVVKALVKATD